MTLIRRTSPFDEIFTLRRAMDRLFEDDVERPRGWRALTLGAEPPLDITTTPEELVVKASLPGWKPDDVDITLTGSTLTISGEMKEEARRENESWVLNEIRRSSFSRTLELPKGMVGDQASASFEDGVLALRIPKAEEVKPRQIRITPTSEGQAEPGQVSAGTTGTAGTAGTTGSASVSGSAREPSPSGSAG